MFESQAFDIVQYSNTAYYLIGSEFKFVSVLTSTGFSTYIQNYVIYLN